VARETGEEEKQVKRTQLLLLRRNLRARMGNMDALTLFVAPAVGSALAQLMFLSPMPEIQRRKAAKELGELNPLPYPFAAANCAAWMMYGAICGNFWVYVPNVTGYFVGTYYSFVSYAISEAHRPAIERIVAALIVIVTFVGMILSCVMRDSSEKDRLIVAGVLANSILVVYYSAPMSTLWEVVKTRDSKSMHFPLVLCNCLNGVCWTTYGLALNDWWLAAPNLFGAILSVIQIALIVIYPSSNRKRLPRMTPTSSTEGLVTMPDSL
jgi:solute carrier family 50 protein (sugar transporter)